MAGGSTGFVLTPHKVSMCILLQAYALPAAASPPLCPLPTPVRQRLALFLLHLCKASDNFVEPSLVELSVQLKDVLEEAGDMLMDQLASRLLAFSSPEELFSFILGLRDLLAPVLNVASEVGNGEDEPFLVEPNSSLGQFLRRCILSFNLLSFEGTCRILNDLDAYRQPMLNITGGEPLVENLLSKKVEDMDIPDEDDRDEDDEYLDDENLESESSLMDRQKSGLDAEATGRKAYDNSCRVLGCSSLSSEGGSPITGAGFQGSVQDGGFSFAFGDTPSRVEASNEGVFLRTFGQVEAYMKEQADLIEKQAGIFPMQELDTKLNQLEKLAPDLHRVHYLRYLNCLSNGDFPAAMDNLHRYFDYSAGKGGINNNGVSSDASVGRFQAGLLTLGSMHAHFGHVTQALQALNEAVRIAQQNNDDSCLAHALAALCHLLSEVGVSGDTSTVGPAAPPGLDVGNGPSLGVQQQLLLLLKRCLRRALELRLPHLVAFSRLALAKFDLKHVRKLPLLGGLRTSGQLGTSPLDVCKTLKLSSYLLSDSVINSVPLMTGALPNLSTTNLQRPAGAISASVNSQALSMSGSMVTAGGWSGLTGRLGPMPGSILQLAGTSHLLRAASWELYGSAPMVRVSALVHATCYGDVASADDLSLAYVKLAQHLATFKGFAEAFSALDVAASKFPLVAKSRIRVARLQLIHERALHRGEIKLAQAACSELGALSSPVYGVDMDLKTDASHRHARTLLAAGQFSEAVSVAQSLFCMCYKSNMQFDSILALLLLADIHKKAGNAVTGLPYALASLTLCQSLNLDLLHATAMVRLAELWLGLGINHAQRALALLHQCMPMILGHGGLELRASTFLAVARCYLCNPSFSVQKESQTVLEPLRSAAEEFEIAEDYEQASEAHYLQAIVFNALGREQERDTAAAAFKKCVLALNKAHASQVVALLI